MFKIIPRLKALQEIQDFEPAHQRAVLETEFGAGRGLLEMPELRIQQMRVK
jgi:hypothetical protein